MFFCSAVGCWRARKYRLIINIENIAHSSAKGTEAAPSSGRGRRVGIGKFCVFATVLTTRESGQVSEFDYWVMTQQR